MYHEQTEWSKLYTFKAIKDWSRERTLNENSTQDEKDEFNDNVEKVSVDEIQGYFLHKISEKVK